MKKLKTQFLSLFFLLIVGNISAQTFTQGDLKYTVTTGTNVEVSKADAGCPTGALTIPSTVVDGGTSYSVTSIGFQSFGNCSSLSSVTIPNSVTSIGEYAFLSCSDLTSVTIPNTLTSIEEGIFNHCSSLTTVTIPNTVTSIGGYAFHSCSSLTSVVIPNSVTSLGNVVFYDCSSLTSVTIPNSITSIGTSVFDGCSGLTSVTIPNSVTSIGEFAFSNCNGLSSVTLPNSVTSIGNYAFYSCNSLTSVTLPNSVTSIGNNAFSYCYDLSAVTVSWTTPLVINANVFQSVTLSGVTLNVPIGTEAAYSADAVWGNFATPCASTYGTDVQTACDSYTWIDGVTYTSSNNTATHTLTNAAGCDSIVTLDLTINNSTTGTDVQTVSGSSYTWIDGNTYTSSNNSATHTLTNAAGCDSVVTLDLTIGYDITFQVDMNQYVGSFTTVYLSGGHNGWSGDATPLTDANNDGIWEVTEIIAAGSLEYRFIFENWTGFEQFSGGESCIVSSGGFHNRFHTITGTETLPLVCWNSCEPCCTPTSSTDVQTACDSYTWIDGNTYTTSNNTAKDTLMNVGGCDSIVTLDLTINNYTTSTDVQTACDIYTWIDGMTYTSSNNTATHTLMNAAGCDSVVTLDLTINNSTTGTDIQTACDSYTWIDGVTYTSSNNTATQTLTNAANCDSIVTLNLTINNYTTSTDVQTACDTYTWIDGNTYTSSNNTATHTLTNAANCDSVVTLDLTINNSTTGIDVQTACDSYTWTDGNTYTSSNNTATHTLMNAAGCDSVVTLDLTINNSTTGIDVQTHCDTYTWIDGNIYTASNNTATHTLMNAAGCDSVVTLDLTINTIDISTTLTDATVSANATGMVSYQWIDCDNNNMLILNETNQSFIPTISGNFAVIVSNTNTGCTNTSACVSITIIAGDTNGNGIIDGTETAGDTDGNGSIDGTETAGDADGNGTIDGTETAGDTDGNGTIDGTETAGDTDGNGSIDSGEQLGDINGNGTVESPELCGDANGNGSIDGSEVAFDCNGDGIADNVGIKENFDNVWSVYPNPTSDILNIKFTDKLDEENSVSVINVLGQKVHSINNIEETTLSIDVSNFEGGVYYLYLTSDKKVSVKTFTVVK